MSTGQQLISFHFIGLSDSFSCTNSETLAVYDVAPDSNLIFSSNAIIKTFLTLHFSQKLTGGT